MVDGGLLEISNRVVDDTEVDVSKELTCYVSDFLVLHVVLNCVIVVDVVQLSKLHVVNTDAIVSKGFSVHIADSAANLEELLVLSDGFLKLSKVVVEHTC